MTDQTLPSAGGSYVRQPDGSLRLAEPSEAPVEAAVETPVEEPVKARRTLTKEA
jgi:hypothetical protein